MGKVSKVVCTIVALMLLMIFLLLCSLHSNSTLSASHHQHSVAKRTVHHFPEFGGSDSDWLKSHPKSTQLNLRQAQIEVSDRSQGKNADGGDSFDNDMRLPVEEFCSASDADGDDLPNFTEFNEKRNMDRDGKTSFKDFFNMHCDLAEDNKDCPVTEEYKYDMYSLYSSIYNHDDED